MKFDPSLIMEQAFAQICSPEQIQEYRNETNLEKRLELAYEYCIPINDLFPEDYKKIMADYYSAMEERIKPENLTCFECAENKTCEYAWDAYNTNGDCLAEK